MGRLLYSKVDKTSRRPRPRPESSIMTSVKVHTHFGSGLSFGFTEITTALALEKAAKKSSFLDFVRTTGNRKRLIIILSAGLFSQRSGNGLVSYYLNILFGFFVDRWRRRPILLISTTGTLVTFVICCMFLALFFFFFDIRSRFSEVLSVFLQGRAGSLRALVPGLRCHRQQEGRGQ